MENQILIIVSVLIGFLMGRWKGSTDEAGKEIKKNVEGVFAEIRRVKYERKLEKELQKQPAKPSPWA